MARSVPRALAITAVVVLGACDAADDSGSTSETTAAGASGTTTVESSSPPGPSSTGRPTPTTVAPAATASTVDGPIGSTASTGRAPEATAAEDAEDASGDCLVGAWVVTDEQMNAFYDGLMTTVDAPIGIVATGSAALTFDDDGTYTWAPDFDLAVDVAGTAGTGVATGSITGSWTVADGVVTASSARNELELSITIGGTTITGSDLANGMLNSSPVSDVTYSCASDAPVLDFATADPDVTVPVILTPA